MTQPQDRKMALLLASGRVLPLTRRELQTAFHSRQLRAFCFGLAVLAALARTLAFDPLNPAKLAFELVVLLPISLMVTFVFYFGSIEMALTVARRRKLLLPEPLVSGLVTLLVVPFQVGLTLLADQRLSAGEALSWGNYLFNFLGMQLTVVTYSHLMRKTETEQPPSEMPEARPDVEPARAPQILLGDALISPSELEMLEARDHYVAIITREAETEVRARLKDLTDSLDDIAGRMVHRSIWVAEGSVASAKRQRDGLWLTLKSGRKVKVARPRQIEVETWLRSVGLL